MLQPVAQGYVKEGKTKIVVIPDQLLEAPFESNPSDFNEPVSSSEDGNSEINENFLIHSILGQLGTETSLTRSVMAEDFGDHHPVNTKFLAQPLTMDFMDSTNHDVCADQDGFIRTAELAKAGIFSGDWVRFLRDEATYLTKYAIGCCLFPEYAFFIKTTAPPCQRRDHSSVSLTVQKWLIS